MFVTLNNALPEAGIVTLCEEEFTSAVELLMLTTKVPEYPVAIESATLTVMLNF